MAINGLSQSASDSMEPVARNSERCGARSKPFLMMSERIYVQISGCINDGPNAGESYQVPGVLSRAGREHSEIPNSRQPESNRWAIPMTARFCSAMAGGEQG